MTSNNLKVFLDTFENCGFTLQIEIMMSAITIRFDFTSVAVRNFTKLFVATMLVNVEGNRFPHFWR